MFGWGARSAQKECVLIVDVRSASVGASLVLYGGERPLVVYTIRVPLDDVSSSDASRIVPAMSRAFEKAVSTAIEKGLPSVSTHGVQPRITHVTVACAAPWYTAHVDELHIKKEKPFVLTPRTWQDMVSTANSVSTHPDGYIPLERDSTRVMVHGYELADPFHKKVQEMHIDVYTSFMHKETRDMLAAILSTHVHRAPVTFKTMPLISFGTLRDLFWNVERFTFFDIGGSVTELGVVEDGALTHVLSIPYGSNHILQAVRAACPVDDAMLTSALNMLARNELHPSCTETLATARVAAERAWAQAVRTVLDAEGVTLPQRAFVTVTPLLSTLFAALFTSPEHRKTLFGSNQEVQTVVLNQTHVAPHVEIATDVTPDPFMLLTALFLRTTR